MIPKQLSFDEEEFADILIEMSKLAKEGDIARITPHMGDWDDIKEKLKKYLKRMKDFASETQADQFNIDASMGWPPRIKVGLSFDLSEKRKNI